MFSSTHARLMGEAHARMAHVITKNSRRYVDMEMRAFSAESGRDISEGEVERRGAWMTKMVTALRASAEQGCEEAKALLKEWDTPVR